jgi:hypothetical protein
MMFNDRIKQLREDRQIPQRKFLCKASATQTCLNLPSHSQKSRKQLAVALDIDTASDKVLSIAKENLKKIK